MTTTAISQRLARRWLDESRFHSVRTELVAAKKAADSGNPKKAWAHLGAANAHFAKLPGSPQVLKLGRVAQQIQALLPGGEDEEEDE